MINDLVISFDEVQHAVLYDVDWAFYNELLRRAENRNVRLTYDNGTLEIMSPLAEHESWKKRLASLIEVHAMELRLPMRRLGSTTYRRENLQKGLEPDECYYIQHVAQVKNKRRIDLDRDPPPDLVIEIELTSSTLAKAPIYASLGVPELWRFNGRQLRGKAVMTIWGDEVYRDGVMDARVSTQ